MQLAPRAVLILSLFSLVTFSYSQSPGKSAKKELAPGYYVVVGAYAASRENIAQNYAEVLVRQGLKATYGFNPVRNMYFVYLGAYDNLRQALKAMQKQRKGKFSDAWVRVVPGQVNANNLKSQDVASDTVMPKPVVAELSDTTPLAPAELTKEVSKPDSTAPSIIDNETIKQYPRMTLGNTEVFLSLFDARNHRIVSGEVQVIDTERAKSLTKVKGNEYLLLPDPKSNSGQLTLICEAFGYRKIQQEINYPLPLADTVKPFIDLMGTTVVINFDLVRYYKGDIATLYNVYFFNDAALMLPESKFELNSLVELMKEGPYRIRLHGHTNGNFMGRILMMGPEKELFTLDGSKTGRGSAKDLSKLRAEAIKEFLMSNGIPADRIEIKAWGGRRPLYDKHSANAKKNVRVEVEILSK